VPSLPCSQEVLDQAEEALSRLDRLKAFLLTAEDLHKQDGDKWRFLSQEARAACIVGVLAELEALTGVFLKGISREITAGRHAVSALRPCLRGLAGHTHFESLRDTADSENIWARRALLTTLDMSSDTAAMPIPTRGPQPPLDGRTLTPAHFRRIWDVFGIDGDPLPDLASGQTLQKLSGLRNDIAHGNLPFAEIFRTAGTTAPSVERYVTQMSLTVIHLASAWSMYANTRAYLQVP
jgi:hypothetical protein